MASRRDFEDLHFRAKTPTLIKLRHKPGELCSVPSPFQHPHDGIRK
jgi:hypothetical protein